MNLILLAGLGDARIVATPLDQSLETLLRDYLSTTPFIETAAIER